MNMLGWLKQRNADRWRFATVTNEAQVAKLFNRMYEDYIQMYGLELEGLEHREASAVNLSSHYALDGHNPEMLSAYYVGIIQLNKSDEGIDAHWQIGQTGSPQWGQGQLFGDYLLIDFQYEEEDAPYAGRVVYRWNGKVWIGFWAEHEIYELGYERLSPLQER
ncbi:hypothetical protein [Persicobacter psychrovividus]|uniref:Uncharacterized protein n=1 Tax=Persicobacter psychrovividus TaxID=387638 RepID=A0ABN6L650_9BACT|nr:hypothetical protein PEPS_09150 [Persicobacter psychrovividus]